MNSGLDDSSNPSDSSGTSDDDLDFADTESESDTRDWTSDEESDDISMMDHRQTVEQFLADTNNRLDCSLHELSSQSESSKSSIKQSS